MPSTKIGRITELSSPYGKLLEGLEKGQDVNPSPIPLLRARVDLAQAPLHIKACLKQTLEGDNILLESLQHSIGSLFLEDILKKLLEPITHAWHPPDRGIMSTKTPRFEPRNLPQAIQDFRLRLKRYDVPISDSMEVATTEALASAMLVLTEDNALLTLMAKAFDNNPNYRHEVGRIVGIREVALSGSFDLN